MIEEKDQKWKDLRSTLSPAFTGSKMRLMLGLVIECADDFCTFLQSDVKTKPVVYDSKDLFRRFVCDTIGSTAFGIKINSLKDRDNEFYTTCVGLTNFEGTNALKFLAFTSVPKIMKFLKVHFLPERVTTYLRRMVHANMAYRETNNIFRPDMINLLMEAKKGALRHDDTTGVVDDDVGFATVQESYVGRSSRRLEKWEDDDYTAQCTLFFLAGFNTTTAACCFMAHELAVNPAIQDRLTDLFNVKSDSSHDHIVWPLSLICLRSLIQKLSISRQSQYFDELKTAPMCYRHLKLKNSFRKRIKPKKQHEIERMAALCSRTANDCRVEYILDFGAGIGHLARVLGYGYGLNVCCLEQQKQLSNEAKFIDEHLYRTACKFLDFEEVKRLRRPVHLNIQLTKSTDVESLMNQISACFDIPNDEREIFAFGIVGLHACGDLAAILLNIFLKCKEAKFIIIAGCCYMKMTDSSYPLSNCLKHHNLSHLSYEAKNISCHHQKVHVQQLADRNYNHLMIHSYRAAIEKILCKYWPQLKHVGLKNMKHTSGLTFQEYCSRATSHLNVVIPNDEIVSADVERELRCWKKIVIFYTLRLMLAPLVESVILHDRMLCISEQNHSVQLDALFDPFISARNVVMTAVKNC